MSLTRCLTPRLHSTAASALELNRVRDSRQRCERRSGFLRDLTRPSPGSHYLWYSGRYQAERGHRGHGGDDDEHGVGVGEPLDRGRAGETRGGNGGGHRNTDSGHRVD
jgi:hypothetical protein